MNLIYQENENECGACVVAMLANELNDLGIDRTDVISKANLSTLGMSVADLEDLASQFGVRLEAYECEFDELKELNPKKWYVSLVRRNSGFHYVIFKYQNFNFTIFDSAKGSYKLKAKDFEKEFANVIFTVSGTKFDEAKVNTNHKFKLHEFISWKMFFIFLCLNITSVGLSLLIAQLFKTLVGGTIELGTADNILVIAIPFIFVKFIEVLFRSLNHFLQVREYRITYKNWWFKILNKLIYHDFDFYKKTPFGTLHELDNHLATIINFYQLKMVSVISSSIFALITFIILATTEPIFILISTVQLIISSIIILIKHYYQKNHINQTLGYIQNHNKYLTELFYLTSREHNLSEYKVLEKTLKQNINDAAKHNKVIEINTTTIDHVFDVVKFIFWVAVLATGVYLVLMNQTFDLGMLLYVIAVQTLLSSNAEAIVQFALDYYPFRMALKKVYGFNVALNDLNEQSYRFINEPISTIKFENICLIDGPKNVLNNWNASLNNLTVLVGQNGSGKSTLLKALTGKVKLTSGLIKINDYDIKDLTKDWFIKNVIYVEGSSVNSCISNRTYELIYKYLEINKNNTLIVELIKKTNLLNTNPSYYSTGQYQLSRLISLSFESNKLILLDEMTSGIHADIKGVVFDEIIKSISKNNFVVFVDHEREVINKAYKVIEVK